MDRLSGFVTLHLYLEAPPSELDFLKATYSKLAATIRDEGANLFSEFLET